MLSTLAPIVALALAVGGVAAWGQLRLRGLDRCLVPYLLDAPRRQASQRGGPVHLLLCIADHFEPGWGIAPPEVARERVGRWVSDYPRLFEGFRDSDGRPPRHTFFYPIDEYEPEHLDALAGLCRAGFGEVEVHLHHDDDTSENLRRTLLDYTDMLDRRHGLLPRRRDTGELAYGFIHGNWALDNARPDGRHCGVNDELDVLRETGCYGDFTLPSAPSSTQTRTINRIYYATDDPDRPRSHERGTEIGPGRAPDRALLLIQGPLVLDWSRRKWGLFPRLENGCLQGNQAPSIGRLASWLRASVRVPNRPEWYFVKLHTHGAREDNRRVLLGEPMVRFHRALADGRVADPNFHVHYVTAREMANLARAAADGFPGPVDGARDYELVWEAREPAAMSSDSIWTPAQGR
jgi:hypothetical protein